MPSHPLLVRRETPADYQTVEALLERAFGRPDEARLVHRLRDADPGVISLVATTSDLIVGHILFTPVTVGGHEDQASLLGLGPMAVEPTLQNQGIGSTLVQNGIETSRAAGASLIFVLGHAEYYPRFGFQPAYASGFRYKSEEFDPYFMVLELAPLAANGGMVQYLPAFDEV